MNGERDLSQVPEEEVEEYKELYESEKFQTALSFIDHFEGTFTCSGVCSTALFYYTLPMS
jgi:hypothetical protein